MQALGPEVVSSTDRRAHAEQAPEPPRKVLLVEHGRQAGEGEEQQAGPEEAGQLGFTRYVDEVNRSPASCRS